VQAISQAAKELVEQRDRWLGSQTSEVSHEDFRAEKTPKKTSEVSAKPTLTKLYDARPTWLDLAHKKLDEAVIAAYGWQSDLSDEQILENLLALNWERSKSKHG
jgi:mannose/cellobiose epimerase-like protein (N-acyl-D-glucosamine 2-epimerase family)